MYIDMAFILEVCILRGVMDGSANVGCDNHKALFLLSKNLQRVRQKRKHADIFQFICKVRTSINLALEFNNVRGHQYERMQAQLLDRPS